VKESKKRKKLKPSKKLVKLTPEQKDLKRRRKVSAARKKELAKLLHKKSRQHGPNPYSAVRFHKEYVFDPIRYTVLTASQMTSERQEMVASAMKTIVSGPEAMTLPERPGWAATMVGHDARVIIVSYLGIEVALFFKRQLTEIIPEPGEKTPEGVMQDPKEAWQRLDLLGRSAEKSHFVLTQSQRRLEEVNKLLASRAKDVDDLNDSLMKKVETLSKDMKEMDEKNTRLEKELRLAKYAPKPKSSGKSKGKRSSVRVVVVKQRSKHKKWSRK